MVDWADDWVREAPAREKTRAEIAGRNRQREAEAAAREAAEARRRALNEAAAARWETLPDPEKTRLREIAKASLRTDPRWSRLPREVQMERAENYAVYTLLRADIEREQAAAASGGAD